MSKPLVSLSGFALAKPDIYNNQWNVEPIDGWSPPPNRGARAQPAGRPGAVKAGAWVPDARAMVLKGICYCAGLDTAMWSTIDLLSNLISPAYEGTIELRVAHAVGFGAVDRTVILQVSVGDGATPVIEPLTDRAFKFSIPLVALDPCKYDVNLTQVNIGAGGAGSYPGVLFDATMGGTFPEVWPVVTATGGGSGATDFRIALAGENFIYDGAIAHNEVLTFDFHAQTAVSSSAGNVLSRVETLAHWFSLKAGVNHLQTWVDAGSVLVNVAWNDGFL